MLRTVDLQSLQCICMMTGELQLLWEISSLTLVIVDDLIQFVWMPDSLNGKILSRLHGYSFYSPSVFSRAKVS